MSSHEAHKAKPAAKSLAAKIALITEGSRGIGAAIALRLAADGARVVISYKRNRAAADEVVAWPLGLECKGDKSTGHIPAQVMTP